MKLPQLFSRKEKSNLWLPAQWRWLPKSEATKPIKVKDFMDTLHEALELAEKPDGQST